MQSESLFEDFSELPLDLFEGDKGGKQYHGLGDRRWLRDAQVLFEPLGGLQD